MRGAALLFLVLAAAASDPTVVVTTGAMTVTPARARSAVYDGRKMCVDVSSGDYGRALHLDELRLVSDGGSDGVVLVSDGRVATGLRSRVRYETAPDGGAHVCFVPFSSTREFDVSVRWSVRRPLHSDKKDERLVRRDDEDVPSPSPSQKKEVLPEAELSGTYELRVVTECSEEGTQYDPVLAACVSATTASLRKWIFLPIMFVSLVAIIGAIICASAVKSENTSGIAP